MTRQNFSIFFPGKDIRVRIRHHPHFQQERESAGKLAQVFAGQVQRHTHGRLHGRPEDGRRPAVGGHLLEDRFSKHQGLFYKQLDISYVV